MKRIQICATNLKKLLFLDKIKLLDSSTNLSTIIVYICNHFSNYMLYFNNNNNGQLKVTHIKQNRDISKCIAFAIM